MRSHEIVVRGVFVPVRLVGENNQREHWGARHRRKVAQQSVTTALLRTTIAPVLQQAPLSIRLVRIGGRTMDTGNHEGAFKHVQDAVARWIGIDDGRLAWEYAHEPLPRHGQHGVRIELRFLDGALGDAAHETAGRRLRASRPGVPHREIARQS